MGQCRYGATSRDFHSESDAFGVWLMSGWVGSSAREAACRAREMARFRRWAASDTGESCISTWNSVSGFSCLGATFQFDTIAVDAVEMPMGTPSSQAVKC